MPLTRLKNGVQLKAPDKLVIQRPCRKTKPRKCKIKIRKSINVDTKEDTMEEHLRRSPNCRFACPRRNELIGDDQLANAPPPKPTTPRGRPRKTVQVTHPRYQNRDSRYRTFDLWPKSVDRIKDQLVDAGFFYAGKGDQTVCYCCGGGLIGWEANDDPWAKHAKLQPDCYYLVTIKGQEYIANKQLEPQPLIEQPVEVEQPSCSGNSSRGQSTADASTGGSSRNIDDPPRSSEVLIPSNQRTKIRHVGIQCLSPLGIRPQSAERMQNQRHPTAPLFASASAKTSSNCGSNFQTLRFHQELDRHRVQDFTAANPTDCDSEQEILMEDIDLEEDRERLEREEKAFQLRISQKKQEQKQRRRILLSRRIERLLQNWG